MTKSSKKIEIEYANLVQKLHDNYQEQKELLTNLDQLIKSTNKKITLDTPHNRQKNSNNISNFNKPEPIPTQLKKLLKLEQDELTRSQVATLLYKYFSDNDMYDKKKKTEIILSKKLRKIFGMDDDDIINFYNFHSWLRKLYEQN